MLILSETERHTAPRPGPPASDSPQGDDPLTVRRLGSMSSPDLVGRDDELARLFAVAMRRPGFAVVEGEAGVGKSRLVGELLARPELRGLQRLIGFCHPLRDPFPLGPIVEALRSAGFPSDSGLAPPLRRALGRLLPELAGSTPPTGPVLDARSERQVVFSAIRQLLQRLGPAVCVIEDLHWADEGTLDLLRYLVPQLPEDLALIVTCRREGDPASPELLRLTSCRTPWLMATHIQLTALAVDEVRALVSRVLGEQEVSEEFAAYLHRRTAGIPFAIEEVLLLLRERQGGTPKGHGWTRHDMDDLAVPPRLRDSILERFGRLTDAARTLAEVASVAAVPMAEAMLTEVTDIPAAEAAGALTEAMRCGVLVEWEGRRFGFRHDLARQAVSEAIPSPRKRQLHASIARVMAGRKTAHLGLLVHHLREAGQYLESVRYAEQAADQAAAAADDGTAARWLYRAVLTPGVGSEERIRLALRMGRYALSSLVLSQEATALLRSVIAEEAVPDAIRGEMRWVIGAMALVNGDPSTGTAELTLAVEELRDR
ncbi:MAG: AAA family ATPase, partial [Candidatus Dormibacteria bacterium]